MVGLYILIVGIMSGRFYKQYQEALDYSTESLAMGDIGNFARAGYAFVVYSYYWRI